MTSFAASRRAGCLARMNKRGLGPVWWTIIALIICVVFLMVWLFGPQRFFASGTASLTNCNKGTWCVYGGCPDATRHMHAQDLYCREEALGDTCCQPLQGPGSWIIHPSKVGIYFNGAKEPLRDDATVELVPTRKGDELSGKFRFKFDDLPEDTYCYGMVETEEGEQYFVSAQRLFDVPPVPAKPVNQDEFTYDELDEPFLCSNDALKEEVSLDLSSEDYIHLMGQQAKYSLVLVDKATCESGDPTFFCNEQVFSVNVRVPTRSPQIQLEMNGDPVSRLASNVIPVGDTVKLKVSIEETFEKCQITINPRITDTSGGKLTLDYINSESFTPYDTETDCFRDGGIELEVPITVDETEARAIPFDIEIKTWMTTDERYTVTHNYEFYTQPNQEYRVVGPRPGLSRDKSIEISCASPCNRHQFTILEDPLKCSAKLGHDIGESLDPTTGWFNLELGEIVDNSGRFRHILEGEYENPEKRTGDYTSAEAKYNDKFLCMRSYFTDHWEYSLGLWRNAPNTILIDDTPPELKVGFDSFKGIINMQCEDQLNPDHSKDVAERYKSGCADKPFSYAYINDPLLFATNIVTGGNSGYYLGEAFRGCPPLDEDRLWNTASTELGKMEYRSHDVRVICVRATDNAGNHVVKSRLLFPAQEAVALLMTTVGRATT